jgi:hypothetical protein
MRLLLEVTIEIPFVEDFPFSNSDLAQTVHARISLSKDISSGTVISG